MASDSIRPLRQRATLSAPGAANDILRSEVVPSGETWILSSYATEDQTTVCAFLRVAVESGSYNYEMEEQRPVVAGTLYDGTKRVMLVEGDRMTVRFNGATASDALVLVMTGFIVPEGIPITPGGPGSLCLVYDL